MRLTTWARGAPAPSTTDMRQFRFTAARRAMAAARLSLWVDPPTRRPTDQVLAREAFTQLYHVALGTAPPPLQWHYSPVEFYAATWRLPHGDKAWSLRSFSALQDCELPARAFWRVEAMTPWARVRDHLLRHPDRRRPRSELLDALTAAAPVLDVVYNTETFAGWLGEPTVLEREFVDALTQLARETFAFYIGDPNQPAHALAAPTELHYTVQPATPERQEAFVFHRDGGPAISFPHHDEWFLNGVQVPDWLAETPRERLNAAEILRIANVDQRREALRKFGAERMARELSVTRIASGHIVVPEPIYALDPETGMGYVVETQNVTHAYTLWALPPNIGTSNVLEMENPSVPGTLHWEYVPARCTTIEAALAFRNGQQGGFTPPTWLA